MGGIKRIAEFMGKSLTDEQFDIILKETSFNAMSQNKTTNYTWWDAQGSVNEGVSKFMRKGKYQERLAKWEKQFNRETNLKLEIR